MMKLYLSLSLLLFILCPRTSNGQVSADTIFINELLTQSFDLLDANPDSAAHLANKALEMSSRINYNSGIAKAHMRLGIVSRNKGKNEITLIHFLEAYSIRKKMNLFKDAAGACIELSEEYKSFGKKDSSFYFLYEALRLNSQTNSTSQKAYIYLRLANLFAEYQNPSKALQYIQATLQLALQIKDTANMIQSYSALGNYYYQTMQYNAALNSFNKSAKLCSLINDEISLAGEQNNMALCYTNKSQFVNAKHYYLLALNTYSKYGFINDLCLTYSNLGIMFLNEKVLDSATYYLNKSLQISREINNESNTLICLQRLAECYSLKGDYKSAYHLNQLYNSLNDSLLNTEKITQIAEMQTKYETEKKEQIISNLNEQNHAKLMERNFFIFGMILFILLAISIFIGLQNTLKEKRKSEKLLLNILPSEVANELKKTGESEAKLYNHVSVLFTDFVNFTGISAQLMPKELVAEIHKNFTAFDAIIERNGLEKIKTIGDAYLAVSGLPQERPDHAQRVAMAALEIQAYMEQKKNKFEVRIGIHSGPVVAGIVGVKKYAYDIWGDTVNTASRLESSSEPGKINMSLETFSLVQTEYKCTYRGKINAKNKGEIDMYYLDGKI